MATQATTRATISPVMNDILDWSRNRPLWQRDALRRLVVNGDVTDDDIAELTLGCLADANALDQGETVPTLEPLERKHVPATSVADDAIRITSLADVKHANALAENQQLNLSADGLTIIYGDNGAGKSGYARILKNCGRARRRDGSIRSNVFEAPPNDPASAMIECEIGGNAVSVAWKDGDHPDELASISSFDSDCATVHVNDSNSIDFTPFGLDLFSQLVKVCKRVKARISERTSKLEQTLSPVVANPNVHEGTLVARKIRALNHSSDPSKLAEHGHFSDAHKEKLDELERLLKSDPETQAKALKTQIDTLQRAVSKLEQIEQLMNKEAVSAFKRLRKDAATKRSAAELHAKQLVGSTPLDSVGTTPWMELWNAARKFSQQALPDKSFPATEDGDVCVLCHQELNEEAKQRLKNFDEFVQNEAETVAAKAEKAFGDAKSEIESLNLDVEKWKAALGNLLTEATDLQESVLKIVSDAATNREALLDECESKDLNFTAIVELKSLIESWKTQVTSLKASVQPEKRRQLQQELNELLDRRWFGENYEAFVDEISRLSELDKLKTAAKATGSTAISTKGGKLATTYVTDELTKTFAKEVKNLCGRDVKVSLGKGRSSGGVPTYQISLDSTQDAKPQQVLSEGEFRCIAIAGFITELSTSENRSTIVLDDPVSSLGHEWRSNIAVRLVEEAANRQVVIFSHDMFFVGELKRLAEDEQVAFSTSHIVRSEIGVGLCRPNLPWFGARTLDRIKTLTDQLEQKRTMYPSAPESEKLVTSTKFYSHLRETCERAVEREFIGGCMHRYENYIRVSRVVEITAFCESDAEELHRIHRKCSNGLDGHDHSVSGRQTAPLIDDMISLANELKTLIEKVHNKRDRLKRRRRQNRQPRRTLFDPEL